MLNYLGSLNPLLAVLLASLVPVFETQVAVPIGVLTFSLHPLVIVGVTTLAGMLIPLAILPLFGWAVGLITQLHPNIKIWVESFFASRVKRYSGDFQRWGSIALILFIAIPGPFTGAWSATILAYLFGIRYWLAVLSIGAGSGLASVVVLILVLGGRQLLSQL